MPKITVHNNLSAEHAGKSSPLYPLIAAKAHAGKGAAAGTGIFWTADWWGLSHSTVFSALPAANKEAALTDCARLLLNEAYFIEKSGLAYTAKMVLMASTTDVAQLYALIGADEARHLAWIEAYVQAEDKIRPQGEFLTFLSSLIEECTPEALVYLVQVILEGWGLDHYRRLADGCTDAPLSAVLRGIVKDEALHHRSGVLQCKPDVLCGDERSAVEAALRRYADMVRVGPQAALSAVNAAAGGLEGSALENVMDALRHVPETTRKLSLLRELMRQPGMEALVDEVDFTPLSVAQAVAFFQGGR